MDTFGWDTVAIVATEQVNAELAAHADELLLDFDADPGTDPPVLARGRFASWTIVPGGAEQLLHLALAIEHGTLTIGAGTPPAETLGLPAPSGDAEVLEYDLAGTTVVVAIDLRLLPEQGSAVEQLVFRLEYPGSSLPPPGPGYVTLVTVIDPAGGLPVAARSLLGYAIATDLVQHAERVTYVLGRVNPVPPSVDSWLAPTASSYGYVARETGGDGCLAILSMTGGRSASGLRPLIDPMALRGAATESYLISGDMVLRHVLLPVLPTAYETTGDAFRFDEPAHALRETRSFETFPVKVGAITYHPRITFFEMRIAGDALRTSLRGECEMKMGIRMTFTIGVSNPARFDPTTKTLSFAPDPNPRADHDADIPWYLAFLGPLAIGITEICVNVISDRIAERLTTLVGTALSIIREPPRIVEWTGSDGFKVEIAGLDSSLYMMGVTEPGPTRSL